jgi:hypothetical protein
MRVGGIFQENSVPRSISGGTNDDQPIAIARAGVVRRRRAAAWIARVQIVLMGAI